MSRDKLDRRHRPPFLDDKIVSTNEDATTAKGSAVSLGYYEDPFISAFAGSLDDGIGQMTSKKLSPLINRGYYVRVKAIRALICHFLKNMKGKQIVSLGAGNDTTYFCLKRKNEFQVEKYIELDFDNVVLKKIGVIRKNPSLFNQVFSDIHLEEGECEGSVVGMWSDGYYLYGCDIRDIGTFERILKEKCAIDFEKSTLFISECVLVYMDVKESNRILEWIPEKFFQCHFILYEQIRPYDNFGRVMVENLSQRGCPLLSLYRFPELKDQVNRFLGCKWSVSHALDMGQIYEFIIANKKERERIQKLQVFDEFEEWNLINQHYCIVLASTYINRYSVDDDQFNFHSLKNQLL